MHTKSFTLAVSPCEATIDLWRVAREILGDAASIRFSEGSRCIGAYGVVERGEC